MTDHNDAPARKRSALRDVSGTTVALTSLAVMGAAAVVSAPIWYWYRRKRKRTDALVSQVHPDAPPPATDGPADTSTTDASPGTASQPVSDREPH